MLPRVLQTTPVPAKNHLSGVLTSASSSLLLTPENLLPSAGAPELLLKPSQNLNLNQNTPSPCSKQQLLQNEQAEQQQQQQQGAVLRPMNACKPQLAKLCRVCGDVALGFNFNGLSCESCKAFFRRNAVKNKVFKCRKNGNCHIDKVSRKYCKRCRLEKCYAIGMKKELIWSCRETLPSLKHVKDDSNEENKNADFLLLSHNNNNNNNNATNNNNNIFNNTSCHHNNNNKLHNANINNSSTTNNIVNNSNTNQDCLQDNDVRFLEKSVDLMENSMALAEVIRLRQYDIMRLQEVRSAMLNFKDETSLEVVGNAESLIDVMNLAELYVKKIITFCKNFSAFTCLKLTDQLIMLKSFHPEIGAIGASFLYNSKRDGLPVIAILEYLLQNRNESKAVFVKLDHSDELKNKEIVTIFRKFLHTMQVEMESDVAIRDLILAQLLFAPRENVSCPEFLKYNHAVYCHLLRRYLEHKYRNPVRAEEKYCALMRMLKQINSVSQCFREVYLNEVDINKVAKILAEIYNLI